jgi:ABC-type multidrug transport system fused ATPase/permease subunit
MSKQLRHTNSCLYGLVSQKLDAMKAIQAYGKTTGESLNFHRLAACFLRDSLQQQRLSAGLSRTSFVVSSVGTAIVFLFGARFVLDGSMTLGKMMFVYGTTANLFAPVLQLTQLHVTITNLLVALQRVVEVLDHPVEIGEAPDAVQFPRPLRKGIRLEHVSFGYAGAKQPVPVLQDICLDIPAGTWLCIMGPSGCGKTTLLYLLAHLYEPTTGRILVDGELLSRATADSLRRCVGFVPQEAQIFRGTVRENICYGVPDAQPREIMAAARSAELHDSIMTMPVQYETLIGEKGTSLSGGQRQRLSLARALLTNPDVLILDDCTSALDAETERRIQATLTTVLAGKTAIIVSQRVSMAMRCHRICTIENGVVTEFGTHEELLGTAGFYSRLYGQQTE